MDRPVRELMDIPLYQMSGREFVALYRTAIGLPAEPPETAAVPDGGRRDPRCMPAVAVGQEQLAAVLGIPLSLVGNLSRQHLLDGAVRRRVGKSVVYGVAEALRVIEEYNSGKQGGPPSRAARTVKDE